MSTDDDNAAQPPPQSTPQPSADNTKNRKHRNFPMANWPTIKIIQPPKGIHSPRPDERCLTYCSQSIAGRIAQREPWCRSICIRKVFPHEVRNVIAVKSHRIAQPDGQAFYPLPPEGQRPNDIFDGALGEPSSSSSSGGRSLGDVRHWEEGWYLWFSKSRWAALERLDLMSWDLERQTGWLRQKEQRSKAWAEWQEREQRRQKTGRDTYEQSSSPAVECHEHGQLEPPRPYPDTTKDSLLVHLPPPFPPIHEQVQNLLMPTYKVLDIFHESFASGAQREFAGRAWEKAWTTEPFKLASVVCSRMWEKWKEGPPDDAEPDGKTGDS